MHARLCGPNNLLIEPDFPCLADQIAKPRPDMNIKVAAIIKLAKSLLLHLEINAFFMILNISVSNFCFFTNHFGQIFHIFHWLLFSRKI